MASKEDTVSRTNPNARDVEELKTGFGRVRSLFFMGNGEFNLSDRLDIVPKVMLIGSFLGFVIGGRFGNRIALHAHIINNQLTKYPSVVQARREIHSASILGFIKGGCMWGWRSTVLAGLFSFTQTLCKEFRDEDDGANYAIAGISTGLGYKIFSGPRGMIVGVVIGGFLSAPPAFVLQIATRLLPEDVKQKEKEKRQTLRELDFFYWEDRQKRTEDIILELEKSVEFDYDNIASKTE